MTAHLRYRIGKLSWLELVEGDITREGTDAIVNAANSGLLGGGGVDGAIHRAAGPGLREQCQKIRDQRGSLPAGPAVITGGGKPKARQVLERCYCNAHEEANRKGLVSVSFPSISTGAFG